MGKRCASARIARVIGIVGCLFWAAALRADEAYFRVPLGQLEVKSGELPKTPPKTAVTYFDYGPTREFDLPYCVLNGDGEVCLANRGQAPTYGRMTVDALCIRVPELRDLTGTLYLPKSSGIGLEKIRFAVRGSAADPKHWKPFYEAKLNHYQRLIDRQLPGGSWFRYQAREAQARLAGKSLAEFEAQTRQQRGNRGLGSDFENTLDVFSGGRAVSENLQLDRLLPTSTPEEPTVDLTSLAGITVAEMDWRPLTKEIHPQADPLVAILPSDQHALLLPNFRSLLRILDEADRDGTPVLQLVQARAEDAHTRERYEKQLCLQSNGLSRLLGSEVISSVAFTGSDPYLPTGTDVAILFEPRNAAVLKVQIATQQAAAEKANSRCKHVDGSVGAVQYTGAVSPDRAVSSYMAEIGKAVVVTNSLAQLRRIVDTSAGKSDSLASLPEYRFFRNRYQRGKDETGLLIVTDKTIRRWCSAKWRIASSRRTRAAAILSHYQAKLMQELVAGTVEPHDIHTILRVADLGTLRATKDGITSSTYGSLDFLTPIAELDFTKVTKTEAGLYERWREGYQRNWSQFFDPIAVRFSIRDDRLLADLTVMPLIDSSEYREFIEIVSGAQLKATSGDPHAGSLLHFAMAVNTKSERLKWASNFLEGPVKVNVLSWLGESISLYADPDPFWADLASAMKASDSAKPGANPIGKFFEENIHRLPVAFTAEVRDTLRLTLFLGGVRAFIEQTAPGLIDWTALKHHDQPYVKITATESGRSSLPFASKLAIYYGAAPDLFVLTLNEDVLKRALDRQRAAKKAKPSNEGNPSDATQAASDLEKKDAGNAAAIAHPKTASAPPRAWLGQSMALQIDGRAIEMLEQVFGRREYQAFMQARAWSNLAILNEWKRLFPDKDPAAIQQQFWQASLICPGGGKYVWNKEFQTMESTVYGHPGEPKLGPTFPQALKNIRWLDFGLTFEKRGLRAKAEIRRSGGTASTGG